MWLHEMRLAANVSILDQSAWQIQVAHLFAELSPYTDRTCQAMSVRIRLVILEL